MPADEGLVAAVRDGLRAAGDPELASPMQRYMRSALPFRGVPKPVRARVVRAVFAAHPLPERRAYEDTVRALWRDALYREERYAAIDLTGTRAARPHQDAAALGLYDELVVTGAWWDFVDEVAARRVGPILRADPERVGPVLRRWARDDDRWRRRTAMIAQLGSGADTDVALLTDVLDVNLEHPDVFVRKAVGWALRQYARTDPGFVRSYVAAHESRMAPLSRREALKHLGG